VGKAGVMIPFCDSKERVMATGHKLTLLGTGLIGTFLYDDLALSPGC
jgi:hypothetical protein